MAGGDDLNVVLTQGVDGLRNDLLVGAGEVQAAHDAVHGNAGEALAGVAHDIDDAGMRAGGEHQQPAVPDPHRQEALALFEALGMPRGTATRCSQPPFAWR